MSDAGSEVAARSITIFTIGFAGKSAEAFFAALQAASVKRVIDVRLNNVSQLAGFTKRKDLEYFLSVIARIEYAHFEDLAPTKELLGSFKNRKELTWVDFKRRFNALMKQRAPETRHRPEEFDQACLLCSESSAEHCHRRLIAERLRAKWGNVEIEHL
jgi:uncharacterized protein (DUF488 family)